MSDGDEVSIEIPVREAYRNYKPKINAAKAVKRLLGPIPTKYLRGLDCVVLSNLSGQARRNRLGKTTSRGRRVQKSKTLGLYHPGSRGQRPWIELYVDQILRSWPRWTLWTPFARDVAIGGTLFHELGHHVHLFLRPEYRER